MLDLFEWASMSVMTRSFGYAETPNSNAMVPFLDLVNHTTVKESLKMKLYVTPQQLHEQMLEIDAEIYD